MYGDKWDAIFNLDANQFIVKEGGMKPPPQAYEACKGKNEGDSAKITTPWGETIKAVCKQVEGELEAMPEGGVHEPRNSSDR